MNAIIQHFQDELSTEERALFEANARLHGRRPGEHLKALIFGPRGSVAARTATPTQAARCLPRMETKAMTTTMTTLPTSPSSSSNDPAMAKAVTMRPLATTTATMTGTALRSGFTAMVMASASASASVPIFAAGSTSASVPASVPASVSVSASAAAPVAGGCRGSATLSSGGRAQRQGLHQPALPYLAGSTPAAALPEARGHARQGGCVGGIPAMTVITTRNTATGAATACLFPQEGGAL